MKPILFLGCILYFCLLSTIVTAKILFYSDRNITYIQGNDRDFSIYMMDDDGSNVQKLTHKPHKETSARWSPDGKSFAFSRDTDIKLNQMAPNDIFIKSINGAHEIRLTDHPASDGGGLTWSPDGKQIAFVSLRSGRLEIHVIDIASRNVKQLTNNAILGGLSASPDWSPDGIHIAYQQSIPGLGRTIYTMDANGKNQKALVPPNGLFRYSPRWSPDGDAILYGEIEYHWVNGKRERKAND